MLKTLVKNKDNRLDNEQNITDEKSQNRKIHRKFLKVVEI